MLNFKFARQPYARAVAISAAACSMALVVGCGASSTPADSSTAGSASATVAAPAAAAAGTANVQITLFSFQPNEITVAPGTTVVWTNNDNIHHTVTGGTAGNPSGPLNLDLPTKGTSVSFKFGTAGEYPYFCNVHPSMVGKVIVRQP